MPITAQQGNCCPNNFVGFCLEDGTPISIVVEGTTQLGWIDLLTGIFTAGAVPPGTVICGEDAGPCAGTAALSNIPSSVTSVTLSAANAARCGWMVFNDSTDPLLLKFGATASATSFTVYVPCGGYYEMPNPTIYPGVIDGIWLAATGGVARVTEIS